MAKAYGYYTQKDTTTSNEKTLCFICATKAAVVADTEKTRIYFEADDYEYHKCSVCDEYVQDNVLI